MNPFFLISLVLAGMVVWTAGSFFFWRISQRNKTLRSQTLSQPVLRLAEKWVAEAQGKLEVLVENSEKPLITAQHELLELRLEASRLPQGVKNLRLVREALASKLSPIRLKQNLADITGLYLDPGDFNVIDPHLIQLKTSLGEMPCLEMESQGSPLSEAQMKTLLSQVSQSLNKPGPDLVSGGFLYFGNDQDYQACLANSEWMEGLKSRRLMVMDFKGLTALLISLRLVRDADKVLKTFEAGVQTTLGLEGQPEKMSEALGRLTANTLKTRTVLEGTPPENLKAKP